MSHQISQSCLCAKKTVTKLLADSRITMVGTIYIWAEMMFQKSSYSRNFISSWLQSRSPDVLVLTMHLLVVASVQYMNPVDLWPTNNHQCKVFAKNIGGIFPKKGTAPRCFLFVHRSQFVLVQFQFVLAFSPMFQCLLVNNPYVFLGLETSTVVIQSSYYKYPPEALKIDYPWIISHFFMVKSFKLNLS